MEYFLGIDIGTTSVKSIAFSRDGEILCGHSVSYPIRHPFPDWSEQDPEEISAALVKTVENILQELSPYIPKLCCFSSAMHSLIAVDSKGRAISPSIIWADNRAADIAAQIHAENKAQDFYIRTGLPVHAMSPFCKLQWIRRHQPDLFEAVHKFIGIKEYVFYKLFGFFAVDYSIAAATGLMNIHSHEWDSWIMEQCGIAPGKLSDIVSTDKIFRSPRLFPSLKEVPFIIGASDGAMANLGSTDEPGSLVVTVGTSSAARIIVEKPVTDPAMRTFCYYIKKDQWLLGGAGNNGGVVLQWLQEDLIRSTEEVTPFLDQAAAVPPGSGGLVFLPYLMGERAPVWNANAKGVMFGLTINHDQASLVRAAMEGVIYCLYAISQPLFEKTSIKNIFATGGFARNENWLQILSDVFNLPVLVCGTVENSAWGSARFGMETLGLHRTSHSPVRKTFHPDPDSHSVYQKGFRQFQRLYELLKTEFK